MRSTEMLMVKYLIVPAFARVQICRQSFAKIQTALQKTGQLQACSIHSSGRFTLDEKPVFRVLKLPEKDIAPQQEEFDEEYESQSYQGREAKRERNFRSDKLEKRNDSHQKIQGWKKRYLERKFPGLDEKEDDHGNDGSPAKRQMDIMALRSFWREDADILEDEPENLLDRRNGNRESRYTRRKQRSVSPVLDNNTQFTPDHLKNKEKFIANVKPQIHPLWKEDYDTENLQDNVNRNKEKRSRKREQLSVSPMIDSGAQDIHSVNIYDEDSTVQRENKIHPLWKEDNETENLNEIVDRSKEKRSTKRKQLSVPPIIDSGAQDIRSVNIYNEKGSVWQENKIHPLWKEDNETKNSQDNVNRNKENLNTRRQMTGSPFMDNDVQNICSHHKKKEASFMGRRKIHPLWKEDGETENSFDIVSRTKTDRKTQRQMTMSPLVFNGGLDVKQYDSGTSRGSDIHPSWRENIGSGNSDNRMDNKTKSSEMIHEDKHNAEFRCLKFDRDPSVTLETDFVGVNQSYRSNAENISLSSENSSWKSQFETFHLNMENFVDDIHGKKERKRKKKKNKKTEISETETQPDLKDGNETEHLSHESNRREITT